MWRRETGLHVWGSGQYSHQASHIYLLSESWYEEQAWPAWGWGSMCLWFSVHALLGSEGPSLSIFKNMHKGQLERTPAEAMFIPVLPRQI